MRNVTKINRLLNKERSPRIYMLIESLLIGILSKEFEGNDKEYINTTTMRSHIPSDMFLPEGFNSFEGATGIEIKFTNKRNTAPVYRAVKRVSNYNIDNNNQRIKKSNYHMCRSRR